MNSQLSIFDLNIKKVKEIRTEKQIDKNVAYDVGDFITGSRKELDKIKRRFQENHSEEELENIEKLNPLLSEELITKRELTKSFSLKLEKENGVEPGVAKLKQLIINRIDKAPAVQTKEGRRDFMLAIQSFLELINKVKKWDDVSDFIVGFSKTLILERNKESDTNFFILGKSFLKFFLRAGYKSFINTASKINTWDDIFGKKENGVKGAKKKNSKWERVLPERPDRRGGKPSPVKKPEDLVELFGFRGVQFGHYMDDEKGMEHLVRASEAILDLADVLEIDVTSLSLDGTLGLAFGARGRGGNALGTYEALSRVINMTKNKGCLGILAHELFHSIDHYIYIKSHKNTSSRGYGTECNTLGEQIPSQIKSALEYLSESLREGNGTAYFINTNKDDVTYRGVALKRDYERFNGDIALAIKKECTIQRESINRRLDFSQYYGASEISLKKEKEKLKRRAKREVKKYALAMAWYHEKITGERVKRIPYPTDKSQYYLNAIELDNGNESKYWSNIIEMAARAFEAYIADKLSATNRRNDYLVYGTSDEIAFPQGKEREKINKAFDILFDTLKINDIL